MSAPAASSGYSINGSTVASGAAQLASQASTTQNVTSLVRLPQVGPATGSPAAAAAWTLFESVVQLKISQLGAGMANDATAMHTMVNQYASTDSAAASAMTTTGAVLGGSVA